jgi:hypothetical protein
LGLNNWLIIDDSSNDSRLKTISFRWGEVRENEYRLGDEVFWAPGTRPDSAAGEHLVPGLGSRRIAKGQSGTAFETDFYLIRIVDDRIIDFQESNEEQWTLAEERVKALGFKYR